MVQGDCRSLKASSRAGFLALLILLGLTVSVPTSAQEATVREEPLPASLDSLVTHAMAVHPSVRAAMERIAAARAAIGPAGALPDPMLAVGISNFPVSEPGFEDFMTMKMVGVGQMVPFPGKLALSRQVAQWELAVVEARLREARLSVAEDVRRAFYELAFLDQATEIVGRNQDLLENLIRLTEARYAVGTGAQTDVLTARVEMARLAEQAVTLAERRRAALARLNAALDRPSEMPVEAPDIPVRIARAAVADDHAQVRFVSAALGSRAADSPLPLLMELQETALRLSPSILAHQAMIDAQGARVALARKEHLPDFDLSLQYGQRDGRSDMVSAMVSISLPLRKSQRQDLLVREAEARLAALHAEHAGQANDLRAEIASAYSDLERERAQLALFVKSIIPQGRAALESATASYQVGRVGFLALLESQATLYGYETQYHRALADFASRLAELERVVGGEVLR